MNKLRTLFRLAREVYDLVRSYGRKKLAWVFFWIVVQGAFQVAGVASIFPFLALAADPAAVRASGLGSMVLSWLPEMTDQELLVGAGVLSVAMLLSSNAVAIFGTFNRARFSQGVALHLRLKILGQLSTRPYSYFLGKNSSALYQKVGMDARDLSNAVLNPLLELGAAAFTITALLASILLVDPLLSGGAALVVGVAYLVIFRLTRPRLARCGQRIKITNQAQAKSLMQYLQGIKAVTVHGRAPYFIESYEHAALEQARLVPWVRVYSLFPKGLIESFGFGGLVAVVLASALEGGGLDAVLPRVSVLALAAYRLLPEAQKVYGEFAGIVTYRYLVREVQAELDEANAEPAHTGTARAQQSLKFGEGIHLRDLAFQYSTAKQPVFEGLHIDVPKNTSLGIVGPTGCGKSTLVDLILGLHEPTAGQILVDDHVLTRADMPAWRRMIGYVPQDIFLLDDSVAANIAFGIPPEEVDHDALIRAAEAAQIRRFVEDELPKSWDTVVGERGVRLSGGQRQRIGLARALYHAPSVLILDEATSALDHETESMVMEAIQNLHGTVTMLVIAHRLNTIENCDAVLRMEPRRAADSSAAS